MRRWMILGLLCSALAACTPVRLAVKGTSAVVKGAATAVSTTADVILLTPDE